MAYRDNEPYLAFGGKIDPLSEIRNAGIITNGSVFWVEATGDATYVTFKDQVGAANLLDTVQGAIDKCRTDKNDYVMVVPSDSNAVFAQGTALDINKDRVHLLGVGYNRGPRRSYTVTVRSNMGTTPDTQLVEVTGDGVEIGGMRFLGTLGTNAGGTMTNGVLFLGTTSHDFWAHDCVFEDSTNIWGTPPVVYGGGTSAHDVRFDECAFAVTGTGNVESAGNSPLVFGGAGNKRWEFNRCRFTLPAGSVTETFYTPGTGAKERTEFNQCHFGNVNGTAFAITSAIRGSTTANSPILLNYCSALSVTALGTDPNVFSIPNQSGTAGAGIHQPNLYMVGTAAVTAA